MSSRFENFFLYAICTLIWGSTWFVITLQVHEAAPTSSVFWRFLIASIVLLSYNLYKKQNLNFPISHHLLFAAQGIFLFSLNYILNYMAETYVSSAMIALTFTTLIYFNMVGMRIFFGKRISKQVIFGALLGGVGIVSIFLDEIKNFDPNSKTLLGMSLGVAATLAASVGNLLAQKNYRMRMPILATNFYGMLYGSLCTLVICLVRQDSLTLPLSMQFWSALMYLSIFGSVIAFGAYLSLAGKIGAEKAAYTGVISPVLALAISSVFENFNWTPSICAGVFLCVLGNILTLFKPTNISTD